MDKSEIKQNAIKLALKEETSTKVLVDSIALFKPRKKNTFRILLYLIFEMVVAFFVSTSVDTITRCETLIGIMQNVLTAIFAAAFTGYAIYQALLGKRLLLFMFSSKAKDKGDNNGSYIEEVNEYFAQFMMVVLFVTVIDLFIRMFLNAIPEMWCMFNCNCLNEFIAFLCILFVLYINIEIIWETKSFIFNTYRLFNVYAVANAIDILKKDENSSDENPSEENPSEENPSDENPSEENQDDEGNPSEEN